MFTCPNDRAELIRSLRLFGQVWSCPTCRGDAVGIGVLRKALTEHAVNTLWDLSGSDGTRGRGRDCPSCLSPMVAVTSSEPSDGIRVEICRKCHFFWFDPGELDALPAHPAPRAMQPMPPDAREIIAVAEAKRIAEQSRNTHGSAAPEEKWKYLPAMLGMPVEYENSVLTRLPLVTWLVAAAAILITIPAFFHMEIAAKDFGLIPAQAMRKGGLTFLTSFFLHGDIFHLIANMYFLLVFGDNVEEFLGTGRYLGLILVAAGLGDLLHIALDPRQNVPLIGASGGISGIVLYYALKYPRVQLGILLRVFFYFKWIRMPAYAYVGIWVAFQLLGAHQQVAGLTNVSALAHLGGAAVGVTFWLMTRHT